MGRDKAIILDFDGTLTDYRAREQYRNVDWDKYIALSHTDVPNPPVVEVINKFKYDYDILIVTARAESSRGETEEWLRSYNIYYDKMYMRDDSIMDIGKDGVLKANILKDKILPLYDVLFCIDDRDCCVKEFRDLGLSVFQCGDGY
jgi:hypothetical protein